MGFHHRDARSDPWRGRVRHRRLGLSFKARMRKICSLMIPAILTLVALSNVGAQSASARSAHPLNSLEQPSMQIVPTPTPTPETDRGDDQNNETEGKSETIWQTIIQTIVFPFEKLAEGVRNALAELFSRTLRLRKFKKRGIHTLIRTYEEDLDHSLHTARSPNKKGLSKKRCGQPLFSGLLSRDQGQVELLLLEHSDIGHLRLHI